jgi:hypothetical protein
MPRLECTIIAQSFAVDRTSNALSIFNILEAINLPAEDPPPERSPTALPIPFSVIQFWSRGEATQPEKAETRVRIVAPNGTQLAVVPIAVDLETAPRVRTMLNAAAFPYAGVGEYRFESELRVGDEWKPISVTKVAVVKVTPSQSPQAAS